MQIDQSTLLSREHGSLPDKYWAQLNGKPASENYQEQKDRIYIALEESAGLDEDWQQ